ncbi:MAG: DUF4920 domain-containing protein [Myxococcales bacterium]|nr:DUF4920 domain-containing protein [Myxococcales bacterium]
MRRLSLALVSAVLGVMTCASFACSKSEALLPPAEERSEAPGAQTGAALKPGATPAAQTFACAKSASAKRYGAKLEGGAAVASLAAVMEDPDKFADKAMRIEGTVRAACTRKGCWMELAKGADREASGARVTFKDYGFFVPTNSAGKVACVEGVLSSRRVAPEEVAHLESEGARFAKKMPDGSAREVRIVATGVEMWDPS